MSLSERKIEYGLPEKWLGRQSIDAEDAKDISTVEKKTTKHEYFRWDRQDWVCPQTLYSNIVLKVDFGCKHVGQKNHVKLCCFTDY